MKYLILLSLCALSLLCASGCAYRGNVDVSIYSPSGEGAMVDKAAQVDSNVGLK